ncbi:hypothetical protein BDQ17DRAFT_1336978 [Cyathus striatus]|nr:hypothetical protein BDQ17DRAFT_1336978 [Cyathus striatus]
MKAGQNYLTLKSLDLETSPGVTEPDRYENSAHAPNSPAADKDALPLSSDPASTDESVTILTSPPGLIDNHFIDPVLLAMDPLESSPTHLATDADITSYSSSALLACTNKNSYDPRLFFIPPSEIVQTKKLEPEILDCASASQYFNRDIRPIIAKSYECSFNMTNKWRGYQQGLGFFSLPITPTLHDEANSECVDLANFFTKLTSKLKQARVANSHSLMKELEAQT